jgi:hypothetical protein
MKTFIVKVQFPRQHNLQAPPYPKTEWPVLTPEGKRTAILVNGKPDGTGFGWDLELAYNATETNAGTRGT